MPMTNQLKFVHSADKLAEMRTKFHIIQAKLIMSVWCFTVQCNDTMEEANLANGNFLYSMLFYTIINSKYTAVYLIKECNTTG